MPVLSQAGVPPLQIVAWVVKGSEPGFLLRMRCRLPRWWNRRYTVPGVRRSEIKPNFEFWNFCVFVSECALFYFILFIARSRSGEARRLFYAGPFSLVMAFGPER